MDKVINNIEYTLKEELEKTIKTGSKVSVVAGSFSMYAYESLKKNLKGVDRLNFIFTSPTFVADKVGDEKREFFIPKRNRERNLYGTEFEVRLRNELTQKAISRECAEWIHKKVKFKSNVTDRGMQKFMLVENEDEKLAYTPIEDFTTDGIGCSKGKAIFSLISRVDGITAEYLKNTFYELWNNESLLKDVTDEVLNKINAVYKENPAEIIYYITLYNIFKDHIEEMNADYLPNEAVGFKKSKIWSMLYDFQKDAVSAIITKLEKYNGCILADSVGLGKTFTALAVIKYYESRNKTVLVLTPKKLNNNWMMYKATYINNPLAEDRFRYDVFYHTDLSRKGGETNGYKLNMINWGNYDLVVIDESHNFRNGGSSEDDKDNRYDILMNKIIKPGVKTKVLMLSATPVNNRFNDLRNQIALAYEGDTALINDKLNIKRNINDVFRNAQAVYNKWEKLDERERTTSNLLKMLDFDFFEILDSVTIARSRKHIQKYYDMTQIGGFPERKKPVSLRPKFTLKEGAITYNEIYKILEKLSLCVYTPALYILDSKKDLYDISEDRISRSGRERGIKKLMSINLLKRLENSAYAFELTVHRIIELIEKNIKYVDNVSGKIYGNTLVLRERDFDGDDINTDLFTTTNNMDIDINDMDYESWRSDMKRDLNYLYELEARIAEIPYKNDEKLNELFSLIDKKQENPINEGNKKIIIFTAFSDTANYIYENVSKYVKEKYDLESGLITGDTDKCTLKGINDMNTILTYFSPISKDMKTIEKNGERLYDRDIDILVATDCISEGQNLQDCDYLINYDIHWNPVRIIQRFGRIDRIGSKNKYIQLVNFWPDIDLDDYINLKSRVEARMRISVMSSTGDDDLINPNEKGDLEYRKKQLERLQKENVDIEEMNEGMSITDLGLDTYRLDLIEYMKKNPQIDRSPLGLHAVVRGENPGVIYVLKNINEDINIESKNRLHPYYLVYMGNDGKVILNHLDPKGIIDEMSLMCKNKTKADTELCKEFNKETNDGKKMDKYSALLDDTIESIIEVKDENDILSFLNGKEVSFVDGGIKGLDDFELICFLVVKNA